jgi:hypothetical protein
MKQIIFIPLRTALRFIRDFDGVFSHLTKKLFHTHYTINGHCQNCGHCCSRLGIYLSKRFWNYSLVHRYSIWWYSFVYNFTFIEKDISNHILIFKCNYLKNKKCSIYYKRPFICRSYPKVKYFIKPVFLPKCGYYIYKQKKRL